MYSSIELLPTPPRSDHKQISPWIDEQIWGHRILDSQTPWLIFLEFLTVAEASHRSGNGLLADSCYPLAYRPKQRLYLRNILFNNQAMTEIAARTAHSDTAWKEWLGWIKDHALGTTNRDFTYLRSRFHSFHDFAALVSLLRSSVVESESNKRWSSRFVFPFGSAAIYEDLNVKDASSSREYIYFGRTGELLYLMLSRCNCQQRLKPHLARFLGESSRWNELLSLLQPPPDDDTVTRGYSYLPYQSHHCFDTAGEDWCNVFDLYLPGFDAFAYLVTLGALHIMLYQLTVAAQWVGRTKPSVICEVVAPRKTLVRELSLESYLENSALPSQAVESYIARQIGESADWQTALKGADPFLSCKGVLQAVAWWPADQDEYTGPADPDALIDELRVVALERHRRSVAGVHRQYGAHVGLVSKRGTNRLRYAPNDALLKTLVLANVSKRMELSYFLARLYERYGLVFGDREAEQALAKDRFDRKSFQGNVHRLEQRLSSLGMLRRLSDACAYVENPYWRGSE